MNLASQLLKAQVLTQEQLGQALRRQSRYRGFLGNHLLEMGLVTPDVLAKFVAPAPKVPETFEDLSLPDGLLTQTARKHFFYRDSLSPRELAEAMKIPEHLVQVVIEHLKTQRYLDIRPRDGLRPEPKHLAVEIRYTLSNLGRMRAERDLEFNSYVGPLPVSMEDYWDWVEAQTIFGVKVGEERLRQVFSDYVVSDDLLHRIGPAIVSGRSIFLFGPTGSGKTALAKCVGDAFEAPVFIPYALYVHGQIIRLYDEINHQPVEDDAAARHDGRWVRCRRPVVIAGGEMTEDALELKFNPVLKYYEAPHQLRANNGIFVIDDFGRQKISPRHLLNRWMYPLETRQDFCYLNTGQQFGVPFDQLIIFCTNLDPYSLADAAFLRRIRHKIFIGYVNPDQYLEIFRRICAQHNIAFDPEVVRRMMARHYFQASRPMCACHPRDLIENLQDRARFQGKDPQLTSQELDYACQSYFVKPKEVTDYDVMSVEPKPII